jgi:hypothetical protein
MKRASAASDDLEPELDHRIGGHLAELALTAQVCVIFCARADDIIRRRHVYNSRTSLRSAPIR